jgi:hypothetical protein
MGQLGWSLVTGLIAAAVGGYPFSAWAVHHDVALLIVAGGIGVVTFCVLGALVWTFLVMTLAWWPRHRGKRTKVEGTQDRTQNSKTETLTTQKSTKELEDT